MVILLDYKSVQEVSAVCDIDFVSNTVFLKSVVLFASKLIRFTPIKDFKLSKYLN